jgi:hypothetical protein
MFAILYLMASSDEKVMVLTVVMANDYGGKWSAKENRSFLLILQNKF